MRGHEAELLVEAERIRPRPVGGELHQDAAPLAGSFDGVLEQAPAEPTRAVAAGDADTLDQRAPPTLVGEAGDEGDLEHADDR